MLSVSKSCSAKGLLTLYIFLIILLCPAQSAIGKVYVDSDPSGASVTLDGNTIGKTPLPEMSLSKGKYRLDFQLDGYEPAWHLLEVTDESLDYPVRVKLSKALPRGSLRIESNPSDAIVYLDGNRQQKNTPITVSGIAVGKYNVRIEKAGFRPIRRDVSVQAGLTASVNVSLTPVAGFLKVSTDPGGASVKLDGNAIGVTPIDGKELRPGKYELAISRSDYETISMTIEVKDGQTTTVDRKLTAKPKAATEPRPVTPAKRPPPVTTSPANPVSPPDETATLSIDSRPVKATIYLDDELIGKAPQTKTVPAGSHKIHAVYPGYKEWIDTRSYLPGAEVLLMADLISVPTGGGGSAGGGPGGLNTIFVALIFIGFSIVLAAIALVVVLRRRSAVPLSAGASQVRNITPHQASGTAFGEYQLLGELGRGGMAVVYKAQHRRRPGLVALKVPFDNMAQNEEFVNRFLRQAEIGAQLSHPRIVNILDSGSANGTPYLAMEYVQGGDLRRQISQQGALPIRQAVSYAVQVCEALEYVHLKHIYHRDIKPENILISNDSQVKVVDFGIALAKHMPRLSVDGVRWLSGGYLCPDRDVNPTSDLYSLGIVLYEMLTGHLPFDSGDLVQLIRMHESAAVPTLRQFRPEIPSGLEAVVMKMMAKSADERYRQAMDVIQALRPYLVV